MWLRFREQHVGLATDIKAIFHQVGIIDEDQPALRFLWRNLELERPPDVLAPYMLPAKCQVQSLWRKNKDWDEPLDEADQSIWKNWLGDLMRLSELELPRCFCINTCLEASIQLHIFADVSQMGFGAVCYARYSLPDGTIKVSYVMARNRVAPLK